MASNKKSSNTSKTAHVMNLLSKNRERQPAPSPEEPSPQTKKEPSENPEKKSASQSAPLPPVMTSLTQDAAVSAQIKSALESALEQELEADAPAKAAKPQEPEKSQPEASQPQTAEPVAAEPAASQSTAVEEPKAEETTSGEEPKKAEPAQEMPEQICLNVMEALVEQKADRYIEMFGLCNCPRCAMDVRALALTNLPAVYTVIPPHEVNFRLAIYEPRYNPSIIAQLVRACKVVMEDPRHDRV